MKIRPVGAELFYVEGRTDRRRDTTKLRVAFRNFAKAPKKKFFIKLAVYGAHAKPLRTEMYTFILSRTPNTAEHKFLCELLCFHGR